jgi:hypothetical protein
MSWSGLASNQMVSYTDAQGGGFTLQSGQSPVTSNQCMTKNDALTKYVLDSSYMSGYTNDQLVPKSIWVNGASITWSTFPTKSFFSTTTNSGSFGTTLTVVGKSYAIQARAQKISGTSVLSQIIITGIGTSLITASSNGTFLGSTLTVPPGTYSCTFSWNFNSSQGIADVVST